eukprot:TRINITY_DN5083_c0_g1_i1.p1 TRINITY_DN5083_c0_g1~~TRINITY_DN5083_c0_g1_i1.p1  ORF type:complete len:337 (+),score=105.01 TRINITY_DN5083_c0_g1_i1:57-1067(+)
MAKVGEGDPRWLVENRADGRNVNAWHWEEKDIMKWATGEFTNELTGTTLWEGQDGSCKIKSVSKVGGEATANNRKGKTIFYYEMDVKCEWEGTYKGETGTGTINLPYISEENDDDEHEILVAASSSNVTNDALLSEVKAHGIQVVRRKVADLLRTMKQHFTLKKPEAPSEAPSSSSPAPAPAAPAPAPKPVSKVSTTSFVLKEDLRAPKEEVYAMLLDPGRLMAVTQGGAEMTPKEGGKFMLFSGAVVGEIVKLQPPTLIEQKWRFQSWPEGHYSTVRFEIKDKSGEPGCIMELKQTQVPEDEIERTKDGWRRNFWERVKMMFGWGSSSMGAGGVF